MTRNQSGRTPVVSGYADMGTIRDTCARVLGLTEPTAKLLLGPHGLVDEESLLFDAITLKANTSTEDGRWERVTFEFYVQRNARGVGDE